MKKIVTLMTAAMFSLVVVSAQEQPIKEDVKDAGKATGRAAKKSAKKTKNAVEKGADATGDAVNAPPVPPRRSW